MTPAELLAPQPPTVPGEDRRAVWGLIVDDLETGRYGSERATDLRDLFIRRDKQGLEKYGHRLPVDSGRNSRIDELQEALDGMAYSRQTYERELHLSEHGPSGTLANHMARADYAWDRHLRCLQTVLDLLEEFNDR